MKTDYIVFPWWQLLDKLGPFTPKYRSTIVKEFNPSINREFNRKYLKQNGTNR